MLRQSSAHLRASWKRLELDAPGAIAAASYALSSTGVTIVNKLVFSASGFHYPWFTLAFQNLVSVALISMARACGFTNAGRLQRPLSRAIALPCLCFVAFIFTNAQALRHLSLPVLTVWKSLGPLAVTLAEAFFFRQRFAPSVYAAMALVALSALVTARFDIEFSPVGYAWAAANVAANVAYLLSLRVCLRGSKASSLDKTFHSNLLSLLLIIPFSVLFREVPLVLRALRFKSLAFQLCYLLSGALTTAVCASAFWTIHLTSGSTMSFIGGMNKLPIVVISYLVFGDNVSFMGWVGVFLGIIAGIVFVRAKSVVINPRSPMASPVSTKSASPRTPINSEPLPTIHVPKLAAS